MDKKDFILEIYKDKRTVFTLIDIALLLKESDFSRIKQKIHYYVRNKALANIRRGIYVKEDYSSEELACKIYTPCYISLDYVLQKEGMIFQYSEQLTMASYLSRSIEVVNHKLVYRKFKNNILFTSKGISRNDDGVNIATPERALLDTLYLYKEFHVDNLTGINWQEIRTILPIYNSKQLYKSIEKIQHSSQTLKS